MSALERAMSRVVVEDAGYLTPCWVSTYAKDDKGYPRMKLRPDPSPKLVHRVVYEALVGLIPPGLQIDHLCRNRACCNPDHLEPVTLAENVRRGALAMTHCKNGHEFNDENVRITPKGYRECRPCNTERKRKSRQKAAA